MAERVTHDEATKAAVMAALLTGQSINFAAKVYKIPRGTVASWSRELARDHTVSSEKKEIIGDLLFDYLAANLKSLRIQAEHFGDKAWLNRQTADALAVLHGVTVDKAIRLLEALTTSDGVKQITAVGNGDVQD
jgi:hypothetical protein